MVIVSCPHQDAGPRICSGCDQEQTTGAGWRYCEGEIEGRLVQDSDGDGVWATPVTLVQDMDSSCGCLLTSTEEQATVDKLAVAAANDGYPED